MEIQASITSDLDKKLYKHYVKIDKIDEDIAVTNAAVESKLEKNKTTGEPGTVIDGGNFNSIILDDESPIISTTKRPKAK